METTRKASFDWVLYAYFHPDIRAARMTTLERAEEHYTVHGNAENRRISLDVQKYLTTRSSDLYGEGLLNNINRESFFGTDHTLNQYLLKDLQLPATSSVLEIDCGLACHSLPLLRHLVSGGGRYCGMETDRVCLKWVRDRFSPNREISFRHYDRNQFTIPHNTATFDLILVPRLLTEITSDQLKRYMSEISRTLKKGGQAIFLTFIWNTDLQSSLQGRKLHSEVIGNHTYLRNAMGEQIVIQSDHLIQPHLEQHGLELRDLVFGRWSNLAEGPMYQDLIHVIKIK